jgi:hypothetical protein
MPNSPFAGDADPRPPGAGFEQRDAAAVRPAMPEPPRQEPEQQVAEEMTEEPGYGHGV